MPSRSPPPPLHLPRCPTASRSSAPAATPMTRASLTTSVKPTWMAWQPATTPRCAGTTDGGPPPRTTSRPMAGSRLSAAMQQACWPSPPTTLSLPRWSLTSGSQSAARPLPPASAQQPNARQVVLAPRGVLGRATAAIAGLKDIQFSEDDAGGAVSFSEIETAPSTPRSLHP